MKSTTEDIRVLEHIFEEFYAVGITGMGGVTRLGYSPEEDEMHNIFREIAEAEGFETYVDEVGNTYAANEISNREYYLIGSHLDSVVDGGRYDGVAGIIAGLMVLKWAKEN
ncbi:MAG: Zn-dependent hydrolase, partial [Firmicutes bacterium]|nr:Zn-dependent hydrolase [Bacillota bacterium]